MKPFCVCAAGTYQLLRLVFEFHPFQEFHIILAWFATLLRAGEHPQAAIRENDIRCAFRDNHKSGTVPTLRKLQTLARTVGTLRAPPAHKIALGRLSCSRRLLCGCTPNGLHVAQIGAGIQSRLPYYFRPASVTQR